MKQTSKYVVIDTNCVLQILGKNSKYHSLLNAFLQGRFVWCFSNEILEEYEEILSVKASPKTASLFMKVLLRSPNVLKKDPFIKFGLIGNDWDDNKFVDCAIISNADYIVTEDSHFNILKSIPFPHVQIKKLDDFWEDFI